MRYPDEKLDWPISYTAVKLIAETEGCKLKAYRCPAGVPTIGWGRTKNVKLSDTCTQVEADRWFAEDLTEFTTGVKGLLTREANSNELGALVSLAYNIGLAGFKTSTVLRKHNEGDAQGAAMAFPLWNQATVAGVRTILPGLVTRRAREAALYLTPNIDDVIAPIAQAITAEVNPLKHSRTILAGTASLGILGADALLPIFFDESAGQVGQLLIAFNSGDLTAKIIVGGLIAFMLYARRDDWLKKLR